MDLFRKDNPNATPESARRWAIGGAVAGAVIGFIGWYRIYDQGDIWWAAVFFFVPWMTVAGAVTGWAIEWQTPSDG